MKEVTIDTLKASAGYNGQVVLKEIDFHLGPGDFIGIIGPNGAGKSTFIRLISKGLNPTSGNIYLNKQDIDKIPIRSIAKIIGLVPQEKLLDFAFTVEEVVLMGRYARQKHLFKSDRADILVAKQVMKLTRISHLADRPITNLSGGEKQRVVIAQALAQQTQILLLDEPTLHLDINHQLEILDLVKVLNKKKDLGVLAVFHDLNIAASYCKHLILLADGKVVDSGPPDKVLTPKTINKVFNIQAHVTTHPLTGGLLVTTKSYPKEKGKDLRVHLVCGGGTGAHIMRELLKKGYTVSAGVLSFGDSDQEIATSLGIPCIAEMAFSPISEKSHRENIGLMSGADAIVITDVPFGDGNLKNLEAAEKATKNKVPLIMLNSHSIAKRDFTRGRASKIINKIKGENVLPVKESEEISKCLERITRERISND
ncbi:hypothetical protein LCGC14_1087160 [marine sediment metagenome]|uniref:ABC transporter domain-containing protein n=1 Tax=marine sediment metagenome TaxID=412755 RepID=A0A0F9MHV1_9ZZZZ|nr:ABC transporter ATP-binding protein [Actinomycetota bacterium]